jgi:hypothetical protein
VRGLTRTEWLLGVGVFFGVLLIASSGVRAQSSFNYRIEADVIGGGGGGASSASYSLWSTIGQASPVGISSDGNYTNYAGFWYGNIGAEVIPSCSYSISPPSSTVSGGGGSGSVSVTVEAGCAWTASTNPGSWDWIGITSGWSGSGNGTVNYIVLANNTGSARTGTLTIAGQTFTITQQAGGGCTYSIFPLSQTLSSGSSSGSVTVTVGPNCPWSASTNPGSWDWIGIASGTNGSGNGTVNYFVFANNTGSTRTGTLTIAGQALTITQQAGCTYSLSSSSQTFSGNGGSGSVNVTAGAGCSWTASTNAGSWDWIGITSGWSGSGNGTVNYFVLANNTGSTRTGTLTIAGQTFSITQQAGGCSYSIFPTSTTFGKSGGPASVNVVTSGGCSWSASTNPGSWDWIGISSGLSGSGNGTVNYFVLPNNTGSARTGTLTIAGQTFTVTQAGQ